MIEHLWDVLDQQICMAALPPICRT